MVVAQDCTPTACESKAWGKRSSTPGLEANTATTLKELHSRSQLGNRLNDRSTTIQRIHPATPDNRITARTRMRSTTAMTG